MKKDRLPVLLIQEKDIFKEKVNGVSPLNIWQFEEAITTTGRDFMVKIGEVSFDLMSVTVSVTERKLRAQWSPEMAQDVAAFNKYSPKGFTVLGVSLDQPTGKERWMEAIHKDNLTWTQVSDLKYWKNEVAVMYGVNAIPQNYLIDDQGIIIGKDLRGDALNAKLAELFK